MPDNIEQRISELERVQVRLVTTLDQINTTLKKFESHIDELFDLKSKIDSIDVAWRRIDELQNKCNAVELAFQLLKAEHVVCKPIVDGIGVCRADFDHRIKALETTSANTNAFTSKLFGSLAEKIIWAVITFGALSAVYLAGKGVLGK